MVDSNSKFGTLLYSYKPIALKINEPIYVQWGRSLLIALVEKPWWKCCLSWVIPGEIEQGIDYEDNQDKFPDEYKKLFEEENQNLVPISQAIKRTTKPVAGKEKKVLPIPEIAKENDLSVNPNLDLNPIDFNPLKTPNNVMTTNGTPSNNNEPREFKRQKSRNRTRFDLTNPIIEHEEEGKGTIEFRNGRFKEESKRQNIMTYGTDRQHMRESSQRENLMNDSQQFLLLDREEEVKHTFRIMNHNRQDLTLREIRRKDSESSERSSSKPKKEDSEEEEEKKLPEKFILNDPDLRSIEKYDAKRSISAKEPLRMKKLEPHLPSVELKGPLNVKRDSLFESKSKQVIMPENQEEDIDQLINNFSQDLERREDNNDENI